MKLKSIFLSLSYMLIISALVISCSSSDDDKEDPVPPTPVKELTFELKIENVKEHGADITVIPSENDKKYIADVAPRSLFENKTEDEIVNMIKNSAEESKMMSGTVTFKADGMSLKAGTEYVLFALGLDKGNVTSKLTRKDFKTMDEKIPLPALSLTGIIGDADGNNKESQLMFNAKSDIAEDILYLLADRTKEGEKLDDEAYIENLINKQGVKGSAEDLKSINSEEGMNVLFNNLEPEHEYTFIIRVSNTSGAVTKSLSLITEKSLPIEGPEIMLSGQAGDKTGENKDSNITFSINSVTKDVYYAELIVSETKNVDDVLGQGITLEELASANKGMGIILSDEQINLINNDKCIITLDNSDGVIPNTEYTCIALVENAMGIMSVARADVKTAEAEVDNTPPCIEVEGFPGDSNGNNKNSMVTFKVSCTTKNAFYAEAFVSDSAFLDDILQGTTLEELMTFNAGIGRVLENDELNLLNESSITLTWDQLLGDTGYSLLFCVKTKSGLMKVERYDVMTAPDPMGKFRKDDNQSIRIIKDMRTEVSKKILIKLKTVTYNKVSKSLEKDVRKNSYTIGVLPGMFL